MRAAFRALDEDPAARLHDHGIEEHVPLQQIAHTARTV
jgi:hypothetical protein